MKRSLGFAFGSVVVYAVVAACGADGSLIERASDAAARMFDAGGSSGTDDAGAEVAAPLMVEAGALAPVDASLLPAVPTRPVRSPVDAMVSPVREAGAQEEPAPAEPTEPAGPTTVTAPCSERYPKNDIVYAIAEFPGKTREELAFAVRLLGTAEYPEYYWPPGFDAKPTPVSYVRDGAVAVECGYESLETEDNPIPAEVTIVLPGR